MIYCHFVTGFTGADQNVQDLSGSPAVNGFEVSWVVPDKHCDVYGYRILSVNAEEGGEEHKGKILPKKKEENKNLMLYRVAQKERNGILPVIIVNNDWYQWMVCFLLRKMMPRSAILVKRFLF